MVALQDYNNKVGLRVTSRITVVEKDRKEKFPAPCPNSFPSDKLDQEGDVLEILKGSRIYSKEKG